MPHLVKTVDLFSGCGGLALGFELHREGALRFETVFAADIDRASLRVFNQNFSNGNGPVDVARRCDLSWFQHRGEVLLYYLSHIAMHRLDVGLRDALDGLGFQEFLGRLRAIDRGFRLRAAALSSTATHVLASEGLNASVSNLAVFKRVMERLGLRSLNTLELASTTLPWIEEYRLSEAEDLEEAGRVHDSLERAARERWDDAVGHVAAAAKGRGRGQHRSVASRMDRVMGFFASPAGNALRDCWVAWRARRDSVRADFCLDTEHKLEELYLEGHHVQLLLGGPPCKGWSRIGRAVIESLRDQGVHAWACKEYGDERNALLHKYVLFLDALRPSAFLFENVAHFQSSLRTPSGSITATRILEDAIDDLSSTELRFHISSRIVRASRHGVPQHRDRFIMVGFRDDPGSDLGEQFFDDLKGYEDEVPLSLALLGLEDPGVFDPLNRTCGTDHRTRVYSLRDPRMRPAHIRYLEWIRCSKPGSAGPPYHVDAHVVRRGRADDRRLYAFLAPGKRWMDYKLGGMPTLQRLTELLTNLESAAELGVNVTEIKALLGDSLFLRLLLEAIDPPRDGKEGHHLLKEGYLRKGTDQHGDWLERLSPDRPCKTVVAHIGKDTYGYIHPHQPRALSIREAARVQSFPDFFELHSAGIVNTYAMVGNAVPPLLANMFAQSFDGLHVAYDIFNTKPDGHGVRRDEADVQEQLALSQLAGD